MNISCDKGSRPEAGQLGYCMAKAGLEMFTKSSAVELAALGIRVNAVAPCFVQTNDSSNLYRYSGLQESEIDDVYDILGVADSVVRERVFEKLADNGINCSIISPIEESNHL